MHEMHLDHEPFLTIKNGSKTIELRLFDEKRKKLKVNDLLVFTDQSNGEKLTTKIVALHIYPSFNELYKRFDPISLGYFNEEKADPGDMEKYYSRKMQEKNGVIGIEIALIA